MKRNLSLGLLWFLLLAKEAVVRGQYAYSTNGDGSIYAYSTNADSTVNIAGYAGPPWAVNIPAKMNGFTVTSIGAGAFSYNDTLASNIFPNAVTSNLTSVIIPIDVTSIGDDAFDQCDNLVSVTMPSSLTSIGKYAFYSCHSLSSVAIPVSLTNFGISIFEGCVSLTNATIPYGVRQIADAMFGGCTNLRGLDIPASVTNIAVDAFGGAGLTNITIPESVTSIGDYAFSGCPLTNLIIPDGVISLSSFAFQYCGKMTSVVMGNRLASIGYWMFLYCTNLTAAYFHGNAPAAGGDSDPGPVFYEDKSVIVYYLPNTTGWSNTYQGVPAVLWNPLIQTGNGNFGVRNNQYGFDITGTPAIPIVVEASTNLANPVWTPLTNVTLTNGLFHFSEPAQPNTPARYYRIGSP